MSLPAANPSSMWKRWLRPAIVVPILASFAVHAAMLAGFVWIRLAEPRRLTDAPIVDSVLTLAPPARIEQPPPQGPAEPATHPTPPPPVAAMTQLIPADLPPAPPIVTRSPEPVSRPAPKAPPPQPLAGPAPPPSPNPGPAIFAGVKSERAARVVYVLDASGAMTTSLHFVKAELARSVSRLEPSQSFQVVVFRHSPGVESTTAELFDPTTTMVRATDEVKTRLGAWLDGVRPSGRSDPLIGLRAALQLNPDLVFLLTRSIRRSGPDATWGQGPDATLAELDRMNPRGSTGNRPAIIKALQFIDPDPTGLLPAIANAHGDGPGSYRVVTLDELRP